MVTNRVRRKGGLDSIRLLILYSQPSCHARYDYAETSETVTKTNTYSGQSQLWIASLINTRLLQGTIFQWDCVCRFVKSAKDLCEHEARNHKWKDMAIRQQNNHHEHGSWMSFRARQIVGDKQGGVFAITDSQRLCVRPVIGLFICINWFTLCFIQLLMNRTMWTHHHANHLCGCQNNHKLDCLVYIRPRVFHLQHISEDLHPRNWIVHQLSLPEVYLSSLHITAYLLCRENI